MVLNLKPAASQAPSSRPSCVFVSARRRDAPAAAQGLGEGRLGEGQRGSQEPGYCGLRPTEAPAVCLRGRRRLNWTGDVASPSLVGQNWRIMGPGFSAPSLCRKYNTFIKSVFFLFRRHLQYLWNTFVIIDILYTNMGCVKFIQAWTEVAKLAFCQTGEHWRTGHTSECQFQ